MLLLAVLALMSGGAVLRYVAMPLVWADELAVLLMCSAAFLGASAALADRAHMALTLVTGRLPPVAALRAARVGDAVLIALFLCLAAILWRWFDPVRTASRRVARGAGAGAASTSSGSNRR